MKHKVLCAALLLIACGDPVADAERAALGPEDPNVPPGELHRPGQPCLLCHSNFALAGTVYQDDLMTAYEGAQLTFTDSTGSQMQTSTNAAGNFIVRKSDWQPVFPIGSYTTTDGTNVVGVSIVGSDPANPAQMLTHIGRDGSCGSCHFGSAPSTGSPGPVYVTTGAH